MNKKEIQSISSDMMLADALLRIKTMENILISKGIFTREEYYQEMDAVTKIIAKTLLEKANIPGNLDEIVSSFKQATKEQKESKN